MAFQNNLPSGSNYFPNQMWRDPSNKMWAGSSVAGEYYRFFDPSDLPYINIKDFGAVGNGVTDDTDAWDEALSVAKAMEMAIYVPAGKYPVTVSDDSVTMNGCRGLSGDGDLVFTSLGNPDRPLLQWVGTKTLIASEIPITIGQTTFIVSTGLTINKGDTIFIASNEDVYSDLAAGTGNYKKGGRFTADTYDSSTGELVCFEPSYYDVSAGYVYLNDYRPRASVKDVSITIAGNQDKKGIEVRLGEFFVDAAKINGFGRFGLNSSSSLCRISRSLLYAEAIPGTTTGYCLQCSGLSDVIFNDSIFYGNRHGVACGDSGYWRTTDVGETVNEVIALPPVVRGSGSRIEGSQYALDSHAGTTLLDVYNCDIYGGIIGGALETYATGCRIHQGDAPMAVRMGRDRTLNSRSFNNKFRLTNCDLYITTQAFGVYADLDRVDFTGVNIYATPSVSVRNMIEYNSGSVVRNWSVTGLRHYGNPSDDCTYLFRLINGVALSDLDIINGRVSIEMRNVTGRTSDTVRLLNSSISTDLITGSVFNFDYFDLNKQADLDISGCAITGGNVGIDARGPKTINVLGTVLSEQNTCTLRLRASSGAAVPLTMSGNTIRKTSGETVAVQAGQSMPTVLVGNIFDGSATSNANVEIVGKYGNIGLDNQIRSSLTGFGGTLAASSPQSVSTSVPGAEIGDAVVVVNTNQIATTREMLVVGYVSSANTVTLVWKNTGTSSLTVSSETVEFIVEK